MNGVEQMKVDWFFGIPGSGKTYIAKRISEMTGIPSYEGDDFHTEDDRRAIAESRFTLAHRHQQLKRIIVKLQTSGVSHALVTHPLPDRKSRALVRSFGGAVRLIHVKAPLEVIKDRLSTRTNHHFDIGLLAAWIPRHWEEPEGEDCLVVKNDLDNNLLDAELRKVWQ
ncbi:MAG: AAA family ATPase [Patescibacteria group bacterium]